MKNRLRALVTATVLPALLSACGPGAQTEKPAAEKPEAEVPSAASAPAGKGYVATNEKGALAPQKMTAVTNWDIIPAKGGYNVGDARKLSKRADEYMTTHFFRADRFDPKDEDELYVLKEGEADELRTYATRKIVTDVHNALIRYDKLMAEYYENGASWNKVTKRDRKQKAVSKLWRTGGSIFVQSATGRGTGTIRHHVDRKVVRVNDAGDVETWFSFTTTRARSTGKPVKLRAGLQWKKHNGEWLIKDGYWGANEE